jgi:Delta7-sterol 5-desaturase
MDIVLEITDTLLFDRLYAGLWPTRPTSHGLSALKNIQNATIATYGGMPTGYLNNFQYKPASQYISLAPSKYAYMTSWQRDDPMRQLLSLYLITWY